MNDLEFAQYMWFIQWRHQWSLFYKKNQFIQVSYMSVGNFPETFNFYIFYINKSMLTKLYKPNREYEFYLLM